MKHTITAATILAATLALSACGQSKSAKTTQQTLNIATTSGIKTMDPSHSFDATSMQVLGNTNEGFLQLGKHSAIEKELATKITTSKDGLTYTFTLRHNAKWNDGKTVDAQDFVYGWRRTADPKTKSEYSYLYSGIKNADAVMAGTKPVNSLGIKALGKYKVQVTLEHPISYFKLLMAMPIFYPQEQSAVKKYGDKYGTTAATTPYNGAFTLKSWNGTSDRWTLAANKNYWDKKNVKLNKVTFQVVKTPATGVTLFKSGKLDQTQLSGTTVAANKSNPNYTVQQFASMVYLQFNQKDSNATLKKAFNNLNIRRALSLSLNRQQFVKHVLADGSQAAKGFVTAGLANSPTTNEDFAKEAEVANSVSYSPSQAKKLWAKGLKEIGATSLSFELLSDDDDTTKSVTEYVQGQWQSVLGAKVTIRTVPKTTREAETAKGNFDVFVNNWGADFSDPITFLQLFATGNAGDAGGYSSAEYDKLINQINTTTAGAAERWQLMLKAEKLLMNNQVNIPIYQKSVPYLQSTKIKNLIVNSAGEFHNYKGVTIKN